MDRSADFSFTIADIQIDVKGRLTPAEMGIEERYGPFMGAPEDPVGRINLRWEETDSQPLPSGELIYDPGSIWRMYRDGDEYCAAISYPGGWDGVLRANASWDDLTLTEHRASQNWHSLLNIGAGELMLRTKMILTGGLIFHASSIDDNGRGIVFVGHAGAGKSTQVGLWVREPGVIPMNDDRIAVRPSPNGAICYGTPWGGTANIARRHKAQLSAIMILEQAKENSIHRLSPSESAPMLLARTFLPYWDKALMSQAFSNLDNIMARVPVYLLRCRPVPEVISLVRSVL
jgi:hypothetical protein